MANFFDLPPNVQTQILHTLPTRIFYEMLTGRVSPNQVLLALGISFDEIAWDNENNTAATISKMKIRVTKLRHSFFKCAHTEFFNRHKPEDRTYQYQLLHSWLSQFRAKKPLPFISLELLETTLSSPESSYELKLLCSQVIHATLDIPDTITPLIIKTLFDNFDEMILSTESEIQPFISQLPVRLQNILLDRLGAKLRANEYNVCCIAGTALSALIPFLSSQEHKTKLIYALLQPLDQYARTKPRLVFQLAAAALAVLYPSLNDNKWLLRVLPEKLKDEDKRVQEGAVIVLGGLYLGLVSSEDKIKLFKILFDCLAGDGHTVSNTALATLAKLYPSLSNDEEKRQVFEALFLKLSDNERVTHQTAAEALAALYPSLTDNKQKSQTFEALLLTFKETDDFFRYKMNKALWTLYPSLQNLDEKAKLFKVILNNLNDSSRDIRLHAVNALWTIYPTLSNSDEKSEVFTALLHTWNRKDNNHEVLNALGTVLAAFYPSLNNKADKTALFNTLFDQFYNEDPTPAQVACPALITRFEPAVRALGTIYASLSNDEDKTKLFNAFFDKWNQLHIDYRRSLSTALGALYPALTNNEEKTQVFNALVGQLSPAEYPTDLVEAAAIALNPLIPCLSNNDDKVRLFKAYMDSFKAWWYKDACKAVIAPLAVLYPSLSNTQEKINLFDALLLEINNNDKDIRRSVATTLITLTPSLPDDQLQKIIALTVKPSMEALSLQLIASAHKVMRQAKQKPVSNPLIVSPPPSSSSSSSKPEPPASSASHPKKGKKHHKRK